MHNPLPPPRKQIKYFSICTLLLSLFFGCNKDAVNTLSNVEITPNGYIAFKDIATFESTMRSLHQAKDLDDFEKSLSGNYLSMRTAYDNLPDNITDVAAFVRTHQSVLSLITGKDGELEIERNIDDEQLATLVSNKGLMQIGNDLYRFQYEYTLKANVVAPDFNLQDFLRADKNNTSYQTIPTIRTVSTLREEVDNCSPPEYDYGGYDGKKRRLKGELWVNNTFGGLYSGVGARTKHQVKTLGIWWRKATCKIMLAVTGTYSYTSQGIEYGPYTVNYNSGWLTDDGRDAYTFDFCVFAGGCTFVTNVDGVHACKRITSGSDFVNKKCSDNPPLTEMTCYTSYH